MARPIRFSGARRRRAAVKAVTFGTAALAALAVISSGGSAMAAPVVPANSVGFQLNANSTALLLDLFGNELTGSQNSVSVSYNNGSGSPVEAANADAEAVLLTKSGIDGHQTAAAATGATTSAGSATDTCAQGSGTVPPGSPITFNGSVGCAAAQATVDPSSDGPQALADSAVVQVKVDASSLLQQVGTGGASQICTGLQQIPQLGSDVLGPACNQVLSAVAPTLEVDLGQATTQITTTPDELLAKSDAASVTITLFPSSAAGNEPLLKVEIPKAEASTSYTVANGWVNTCDATLIKISGTLVDDLKTVSGGQFPDPFEIPPASCGANNFDALNNSPLGQLLTIDLASGSTSGNSVTAEGLKVNVLPSGPGGGIVIDTSGVGTGETAAAGSSGGQTANNQSTTTSAPAPAFEAGNGGPATSPTAVHTGEWWSGSLPLLALLAALGGGLIGWPRIRRTPLINRMVSRSSR